MRIYAGIKEYILCRGYDAIVQSIEILKYFGPLDFVLHVLRALRLRDTRRYLCQSEKLQHISGSYFRFQYIGPRSINPKIQLFFKNLENSESLGHFATSRFLVAFLISERSPLDS